MLTNTDKHPDFKRLSWVGSSLLKEQYVEIQTCQTTQHRRPDVRTADGFSACYNTESSSVANPKDRRLHETVVCLIVSLITCCFSRIDLVILINNVM